MIANKERNSHVDIIRGIAILLVVLGHTMTGSTLNSQDSFLFNIVWSLQENVGACHRKKNINCNF